MAPDQHPIAGRARRQSGAFLTVISADVYWGMEVETGLCWGRQTRTNGCGTDMWGLEPWT